MFCVFVAAFTARANDKDRQILIDVSRPPGGERIEVFHFKNGGTTADLQPILGKNCQLVADFQKLRARIACDGSSGGEGGNLTVLQPDVFVWISDLTDDKGLRQREEKKAREFLDAANDPAKKKKK